MASEAPPVPAQVEPILAEMNTLREVYNVDKPTKIQQLTALKAKLETILSSYKPKTGADRAQVLFWRGTALFCFPDWNEEAERLLSKAVKLAPKDTQAWTVLGELYWKKQDPISARNCFENALKINRDKRALRGMSTVLRNVPTSSDEERTKSVSVSVQLAKEAVALDITDDKSWYNIGNAYLSLFFRSASNWSLLTTALKAYHRAAEGTEAHNPDLQFNLATVLSFTEDFGPALEAYRRAGELDPSMPSDTCIENVHSFVNKVVDLVAKKYGIKKKRRKAIAASLSKPKHLELDPSRKVIYASNAALGENTGAMLVLKVVAPLNREQGEVPLSFVALDAERNLIPITIYNVTLDLHKLVRANDVMHILDPFFKAIDLGDDSGTKYNAVQVYDATSLRINGEPLDKAVMAQTLLTMSSSS